MLTEKIDIERNIILHRSQGISFTQKVRIRCPRRIHLHRIRRQTEPLYGEGMKLDFFLISDTNMHQIKAARTIKL